MSKITFSQSFILKKMGNGADKISACVSQSAIGRAFSAYDEEKNDAKHSRILMFLSFLFSKLKLKSLQIKLMKGLSQSPVLSFINDLRDRLLSAKIRQYGVAVFSFGFYSLAMYFLGIYSLTEQYKGNKASLYIAVLAMAVSLPMLFSSKTLIDSVFTSPFGVRIFTGVFGFRKENRYSDIKHKGKTTLSLVIGMLLGVATFFVSAERMFLTVLFILLCMLVLSSPEGGIVLLISLYPICDERTLMFSAVFIVFSFFLKVIRGKRSFKIELCDLSVLLYLLLVLFGGLFSIRPDNSISYSLTLIVYLLLYFVLVNSIGSKVWISRVRSAFLFSLTLCIIAALAQSIGLNSTHILLEYNLSTGTVVSLFDSSEAFALMLVLCGFIPISSFINAQNTLRRAFIIMIIALELYCLYITSSYFAILAFIVALAVLLLIYSNKNIFLILFFAIFIPVSQYVLPNSVNERISELISGARVILSERVSVWRSSLYMMFDNFFGGVGKGMFSVLFPSYATESNISSQSCYNIYLREIIETGIFGLLIFLFFILLFFQSNRKVFKNRDKNVIPDTAVALAGVVGLLLCGFVFDIWENQKIFMMFWLMVAFNCATGRYNILKTRKTKDLSEGGEYSCDI